MLGIACTSNISDQEDEILADTAVVAKESRQMELSNEVVKGVIKKTPSPLELTNIVKGSGIYFSKEMLNSTDHLENYLTGYQKALNLGVYGADLGCINIYEKTHLSIGYIDAVKTLADDLKVGQFFDFATLRRLVDNSDNVDSLLYISTRGFQQMHDNLYERGRSNISILVLVGGWLESLYIATYITSGDIAEHFFEEYPELINRIGEQKIALDNIIILLNAIENNPGINQITVGFEELRDIYRNVKITYVYEEPEMEEVDGALVVRDKSTITVDITPEQLYDISAQVQTIRDQIIL